MTNLIWRKAEKESVWQHGIQVQNTPVIQWLKQYIPNRFKAHQLKPIHAFENKILPCQWLISIFTIKIGHLGVKKPLSGTSKWFPTRHQPPSKSSKFAATHSGLGVTTAMRSMTSTVDLGLCQQLGAFSGSCGGKLPKGEAKIRTHFFWGNHCFAIL